MNDITFKIIELFIIIIVAVITRYTIPYIKLNIDEQKINQAKYWINVFVGAAEMIFGAKTGEEKLNYVLKNMSIKINELGIKITEDNLRALIEDAVYSYINSKEE